MHGRGSDVGDSSGIRNRVPGTAGQQLGRGRRKGVVPHARRSPPLTLAGPRALARLRGVGAGAGRRGWGDSHVGAAPGVARRQRGGDGAGGHGDGLRKVCGPADGGGRGADRQGPRPRRHDGRSLGGHRRRHGPGGGCLRARGAGARSAGLAPCSSTPAVLPREAPTKAGAASGATLVPAALACPPPCASCSAWAKA